MDSKFGPDGALYVQTYDGFFRAGPNVGIYRYDYVGGAPTPGAAPRACRSAPARSASRAPARAASPTSGTSATAQTSTEANPTHTYAEAKRYTAKLTVTYGDGATDSNTIDVDVLAPGRRDRADHDGRRSTRPAGRRRHLQEAGHGHAGRDRRGRRLGRGPTSTASTTASGPPTRRPSRRSAARHLHSSSSARRTARATSRRSSRRVHDRRARRTARRTSTTSSTGTTLDPKWTILRADAGGALVRGRRAAAEGPRRRHDRRPGHGAERAAAERACRRAGRSHDQARRLDAHQRGRAGRLHPLAARENPNTFAKITYIYKGTSRSSSTSRRATTAQDIQAGPQISRRTRPRSTCG